MSGRSVWLQRPPSATVAGRVFCIPHAGCGTSVFRNWPRERGLVEFLPVELPGRLTRFADAMPGTVQDLAAEMVEGLAPYLDVPFAFFGHCWSALPAYEATVLLERAGDPVPARLFVSSLMAPRDEVIGRLMTMDEEQLAVELEKTLRDMGSTPHPELVAIYAGILRADLDVSRRYVPTVTGRLACPVTAVGWSEDDEVAPAQMTGWADCGDTTFVVHAGRHDRLVDAPAELVDGLARDLRTSATAGPQRRRSAIGTER
jgi:surfactin synthase thioesterase subunit